MKKWHGIKRAAGETQRETSRATDVAIVLEKNGKIWTQVIGKGDYLDCKPNHDEYAAVIYATRGMSMAEIRQELCRAVERAESMTPAKTKLKYSGAIEDCANKLGILRKVLTAIYKEELAALDEASEADKPDLEDECDCLDEALYDLGWAEDKLLALLGDSI